jgi:hypothetical protein
MQQKVNDVQSRKAEENILAKAELEIKPLQDKIDALGEKNQKLADKAALAGESLGALQSQAATLKAKLDGLEKSVSAASFNKLMYKAFGLEYEGSEQQKTDTAAVEQGRRDIGLPKSVVTIKGPTHPKSTVKSRTVDLDTPGGATDLVDKVTKGLEKGINAKDVIVYADKIAMGGGAPAGGYTKSTPMQIAKNSSYKMKDNGFLDDAAKRAILTANPNLTDGNYFKYGNTTYKVNSVVRGSYNGVPYISTFDVVAQKALGGPVAKGRKYLVNDRINPLGFQQEVFVPNMSGTIYPNINTMPRYNIPTNTIGGVNSGMNNSYNNNTYNIDIDLNGTNVTADDIMRRFKSELALINAKEGRVRTVGGNY